MNRFAKSSLALMPVVALVVALGACSSSSSAPAETLPATIGLEVHAVSGLKFDKTSYEVVAGDVAVGRWCAMFSTNDRLTGVLGVSMPKLVMPSRAMLSTYTSRYDALQHFAAVVAAQNK